MYRAKYYELLRLQQEKICRGEGGRLDSAKTSPSDPVTTSGVQPVNRRRGAQPGNLQALKHGGHTAENLALKREIGAFIRHVRDVAEEVEVRHGGRARRRRRKAAPA